jgi:hypothetical protein
MKKLALLSLCLPALLACDADAGSEASNPELRSTESMVVTGTDGNSYTVTINYDSGIIQRDIAIGLITHVQVVGGNPAGTPRPVDSNGPSIVTVRPADPHWDGPHDHPFEVHVTPETGEALTEVPIDDSSWRWIDPSDIPAWDAYCPPGHAG